MSLTDNNENVVKEIIVQRANKVLRVSENEKDAYLAKGYNVVNQEGKIVERTTVQQDPKELQRIINEQKAQIEKLENAQNDSEKDERIKELEDTIEELKETIEDLQAQVAPKKTSAAKK